MLYIVVHLFVRPGKESQFRIYEALVLTLFRRHGGEVMLTFRPKYENGETAVPYEIHVLRTKSRAQLDAFRNDKEYLALVDFRNEVLTDTQLFLSDEVVIY